MSNVRPRAGAHLAGERRRPPGRTRLFPPGASAA